MGEFSMVYLVTCNYLNVFEALNDAFELQFFFQGFILHHITDTGSM